jgi:dUTP pyrophosphatase
MKFNQTLTVEFMGPEPRQATPGAAAFDLVADINEEIEAPYFESIIVPTGTAVAIPYGYAGLILPRSGLSRDGLVICNSPGLIDSDYRGVIGIIVKRRWLFKSMKVKPQMRLAQLLIIPVQQVAFERVTSLTLTVRGSGGFGSTGET